MVSEGDAAAGVRRSVPRAGVPIASRISNVFRAGGAGSSIVPQTTRRDAIRPVMRAKAGPTPRQRWRLALRRRASANGESPARLRPDWLDIGRTGDAPRSAGRRTRPSAIVRAIRCTRYARRGAGGSLSRLLPAWHVRGAVTQALRRMRPLSTGRRVAGAHHSPGIVGRLPGDPAQTRPWHRRVAERRRNPLAQ